MYLFDSIGSVIMNSGVSVTEKSEQFLSILTGRVAQDPPFRVN